MNWNNQERRAAPRYAAAHKIATLGWLEESEFRTGSSTIWNVSLVGALVEAGTSVPVGANVWVRLEPPRETDWVAGTVVERETVEPELYLFRVRLLDPHAYRLLEAAVDGFGYPADSPGTPAVA
jgi:hypothetical protein